MKIIISGAYMYEEQGLQTKLDKYSRCEEPRIMTDHGKSLHPIQKTDVEIQESMKNALWKNSVLRALDYREFDIQVKNGVGYLNGHIGSTTSQSRIINALRAIPGLLEIKNNLVLDDKLAIEVAASLGKLEHMYACKFFTGVTHGVVMLNGEVSHTDVRDRAEQCAADHPQARGVINYIRVPGVDLGSQDHRLLQPPIGEKIYFRNGKVGFVRKVVINPDNRRVVAMTIQGHFEDVRRKPTFSNINGGQPEMQLLLIPMSAVRHLTKNSGFLTIRSTDSAKYQHFDASHFTVPNTEWVPPYPYCPADVLWPVAYQQADRRFEGETSLASLASSTRQRADQRLFEELLYNDSIGG
jgi:osmotically-inducible protein OsmY